MVMLEIVTHEIAKSLGLNVSASCNEGLKKDVEALVGDKKHKKR